MREQVVRTEFAHFVAGQWSGKNTSGYDPVGDQVIVLPDKAAEKVGKAGLIHVPVDVSERNSLAAETGVIVAIGAGAFRWSADRTREFAGAKPEPGQRVVFTRYAGTVINGADGETYRIMSDNVIQGVANA